VTKASDNVFPRVIHSLNTSDQAAPSDSSWKVYAKAGGIYARSSNAIVGPFGEAGASGAPETAQYIVGASDGTLSAEKVRADLYKNYHPDNYPTSGTTWTDEFDDSSLDGAWTWDSAPGGTVSESTYPGFLYLTGGTDSSATIRLLRRSFSPGGSTAFSVAAKMNVSMENGNYSNGLGLRILDSSDATLWSILLCADGTSTASDGYRIITTASTWITAATVPMITAPQYLLITRDASNVYKGYMSVNGIVWQYLGTSTVSTAVAKVAIIYGVDSDALDDDATVDFVRVFTTETKKIGA
jgi:hypothetical protein